MVKKTTAGDGGGGDDDPSRSRQIVELRLLATDSQQRDL